jgi:hypothetical protein
MGKEGEFTILQFEPNGGVSFNFHWNNKYYTYPAKLFAPGPKILPCLQNPKTASFFRLHWTCFTSGRAYGFLAFFGIVSG